MNHRKFTAVLSAAVLCTVIPLTGCAKAEKEFQILYEDVAEICLYYNVPLVKTQMKEIIVTAKTLYSHPKNVSKIYAALHTDLAW